jgi:hypothetical protein
MRKLWRARIKVQAASLFSLARLQRISDVSGTEGTLECSPIAPFVNEALCRAADNEPSRRDGLAAVCKPNVHNPFSQKNK